MDLPVSSGKHPKTVSLVDSVGAECGRTAGGVAGPRGWRVRAARVAAARPAQRLLGATQGPPHHVAGKLPGSVLQGRLRHQGSRLRRILLINPDQDIGLQQRTMECGHKKQENIVTKFQSSFSAKRSNRA